MPTALCEKTDVEMIWSEYGVFVRIDDDDATASEARADAMIEKASADVLIYLLQNYTIAGITSSTWVKWCAATFAAVEMARRRGNSPPPAMFEEYQRYIEFLKLIQAGQMALPGDTGLVAPKFDNTPMHSNLRVDTRSRAIVRRNPVTSTAAPQAAGRKGFDLNSGFLYW